MKLKIVFIAIFVTTIILNGKIIKAQDSSDLSESEKAVITEMASKLQQKVLLSDFQKEKILPILKEFAKKIKNTGESTGEIISSYQNQISTPMDARQKAKYEIIKKDWWNSLIEELNNTRS